ncbi:hypothetical protein BX600DRAFT_475934 [Xylariales sp. PMI_506]|nr:hypothetical protein BX600DRAFT_475934 [Xylariales sp. PMI_506]
MPGRPRALSNICRALWRSSQQQSAPLLISNMTTNTAQYGNLSPSGTLVGQHRQHQTRLPHTCEWISTEPAYQAWRAWDEGTAPVLWVHGPPGIGKSFLADFTAADAARSDRKSAVLTCFCHAFSTPTSIVQTLLAQLSRDDEHCAEEMRARAAEIVRETTTAEQSVPFEVEYKFWDSLRSVITSGPRLTLVVDGLDELSPKYLSTPEFDLPARLVDLTTIMEGYVRLIVLSRTNASISRALADSATIQVTAAKISNDIETFAASEIAKHTQLEPYASEIKSVVVQRAEGIFLWGKLAVDILAGQPAGDILSRLDTLSPPLNSLYSAILEKQSRELDPNQLLLRNFVLQWVFFAVRPVQKLELAASLELDTGVSPHSVEETLIQVCGNLIKVENGVVKPLHHSMREFIQESELPSKLLLNESESNLSMAKILLRYLSRPEIASVSIDIDSGTLRGTYPLIEYATLYWVHHVSKAARGDDELKESIKSFLSLSNLRTWLNILLPRLLPLSVLPVPPRLPINAQFFYTSLLRGQILDYFGADERQSLEAKFSNEWRAVYEGLENIQDSDDQTRLRRTLELAELYNWLPGCEEKPTPLLWQVIGEFADSKDAECTALCLEARQALADKLKREGHYGEAQKLLEETLEIISTAQLDRKRKDLVRFFALDSLGWILSRQSQWGDAAMERLEDAVEIATLQFGSGSPYLLRPKLALAEGLANRGRLSEAEAISSSLEAQIRDLQERSLAIPRDSLSQFNTFAAVHMIRGNWAAAMDAYRVVIEDRTRAFGADHRLTLWATMRYARAAKEAGDLKYSREILDELLPRQKQVLGPDHRDVKETVTMLNQISKKQG